jgi:N6-L-threonylcarbamoyladenine synthase
VLHELQSAQRTFVEDADGLQQRRRELAHMFQESVVDILTRKARDAVNQTGAKAVILAGGVAANTRLREVLIRRAGVPVYVPPIALCTDNAAMIAACAYWRPQVGDLAMTVDANLAFV